MNEQPTALRIADELLALHGPTDIDERAAAELRRMHRELQRLTQQQMQPCAGRNCGSTNPNLHSAECFEDYEKSTGMAQPEQKTCLVANESCKHGSWCSEVYCQEHCKFVEQPAQPEQKPMKHGGRPMTLRECMEAEKPAQPEQEPMNRYCCHFCFSKSGQMFLDRMILCHECGNKRCPKATSHELPCTNSNEPNQDGSIYTAPPQRKPLTDEEIYDMYNEPRSDAEMIAFARAVEEAVWKKNS